MPMRFREKIQTVLREVVDRHSRQLRSVIPAKPLSVIPAKAKDPDLIYFSRFQQEAKNDV